MPQELSILVSFAYLKNGVAINKGSTAAALAQRIDIDGNYSTADVQNIGTADEVLDLGDVVSPGWIWVHNMDVDNIIRLGDDGSRYPVAIHPGEAFPLHWNGNPIHAKADDAASDLEYAVLPDAEPESGS